MITEASFMAYLERSRYSKFDCAPSCDDIVAATLTEHDDRNPEER
jgi:hypothetical protein